MVYAKDPLIRFNVILINDPNCDINAPCKKKVEVVMEDAKVFLGPFQDGKPYVTINGKEVNIPYKKSTPSIRMVSMITSCLMFVATICLFISSSLWRYSLGFLLLF